MVDYLFSDVLHEWKWRLAEDVFEVIFDKASNAYLPSSIVFDFLIKIEK